MTIHTFEDLNRKLSSLLDTWHLGARQGNDGNAGNTLEDLLNIPENNLSLPDFGPIEIKTQRDEGGALLTLFHSEPQPRQSVPKLLKCLGWKHREAGIQHPDDEMSFRSTTSAHRFSDRGFSLEITDERIYFVFDPERVNRQEKDRTGTYNTYQDWLLDVESRTSPNYRDVLPVYYELKDLYRKFVEKLDHTLLVLYKRKKKDGLWYIKYLKTFAHSGINSNTIPALFREGKMVIDFDARTGHNHGTKFRIQKGILGHLYE